jgi:peptidyl-Lys metalloendopeptidase
MPRLICLTILLAAVMPACAQEPSMRIRCELSMPKSLQRSQPAELVFTLTNAGNDVVQILNWQTPFEGIKAPMFDVARDGIEVEYHGRMLKRGAPRKEDYFVLKPGESKQARIDLAEGWNSNAPGNYTVAYAAELFDAIAGSSSAPRGLDEFKPVPLDCNSVSFSRARE